MNTTPQQILNIEDALVSDDNPARNEGFLDYERCARLHNYLVAYAWMVRYERDTPDLDALASRPLRFMNEDTEAVRERLDPSLNSFLDLIYDPEPELFYWVNGVIMDFCDITFPDEHNNLEDKERFVVIYDTVPGLGPHNLGVVYDQQLHRASFPMTITNSESVEPIDEHEDLWFPLETILTHWVNLIRMGKVVADSRGEDLPDDVAMSRSQIGLWAWLPYCSVQIDNTVAAMDRYSAAIESRMPPESLSTASTSLFTDADLDTASVPKSCFIRSVLTRVKTPRFNLIAPGLEVPHDKVAFARRQQFTDVPRDEASIPPILLFAAESALTVNFNKEIRWSFLKGVDQVTMNESGLIPTGLYSESVCRCHYDEEEAGFRLLLPFALRSTLWDNEGARMSDGSLVTSGSFTELFQHGHFHPFGGERRAQRLERLFNRWTELIENGVWTVGRDGVEGGIDTFRDADNGNGAWMDYWIAPDW
ncbi:hypothetical protein PENANT_c001G00105 [Penicillium antarcticum]|uniref:Uncharacterized protein n=1 Tax=Penicillium antarcticum TaxID=416450 RepID=A0A1V6QPJ3_9EURO|nr:uncharacterized protein N7508_010651 [Penicillium antarcticum]KAJ5295830.1 hypothetical protein N7508_010651 [Penicillium antarcticum]OQD91115.1 hypothetical protein PENANT_c001G00105 [Penicillium antarcticum]